MLKNTHRGFGMCIAIGTITAFYSRNTYEKVTPLFYSEKTGIAAAQIGITMLSAFVASTLPDIDQKFSTHRGITHAIWIPSLFLLAALFLPFTSTYKPWAFSLFFGLFLGWFSHLLGDAFSKAGIAWFYPFQKYRHYGSGAFVVKGPRGPFQPLYSVGDKRFALIPYLWWAGAGAMLLLLIKVVFR